MKILITGAAGFIGSHLAERLVLEKHEVVGLDAFTSYYPRVLKEINAQEVRRLGAEIEEINLCSDDLFKSLNGVTVVYHLAAQPGISASTPFEDYLNNNVVATERLLQAVEAAGSVVFFINIGTSSSYGLHATCPEDSVSKPASYYGVTKLAAEQMVLARQRQGRINACSCRLYSVYGPRERPEKLYPRVFRSLYTDYVFPLYEGSLEHRRSYTYVSDIVDGLVSVLESMEVCNGEVINLGREETITTKEAIDIIRKIAGVEPKYEIKPQRLGDQFETQAIIDKARKLLDYYPAVAPEEGFRKSIEWYKETIVPLIKSGMYPS